MERSPSAQADLRGGVIWIALGAGIAVLSWRMDRLEHMHVNPYTVPGLVPGLLGAGLVVLGALLAWRAIHGGALARVAAPVGVDRIGDFRVVATGALCILYATLLIGHLPFWLATTIFVFVFTAAFDYKERRTAGTLARGLVVALIAAAATAAAVSLVFEDLFLVRLP